MDAGLELVSLTAAMESPPLSCAFSPDGTKLAVTETNGNVMIWSAMVREGEGALFDCLLLRFPLPTSGLRPPTWLPRF